jgi:multidrug efflux pump subunit AcrA (membrane-fusion protein)
VEIVQLQLDLTSLRSPLAGEVQRILVAEGQFVRAGDPLAIVADTSKVKVEIPVERVLAEAGKNISLKIETLETEGRIEAVLPLLPKFDILRDLFDSIASSLVVVENSDGKWKVGQTVYVPLIPRHAVVEVPMTSIGNLTDGQRKVQILRQNVVRDIPISLLGQVGATRTFVSGPFVEGDEVIYESTHQLNDGFQLKTAAGAAGTAGADKSGVPPNPAAKPVGF